MSAQSEVRNQWVGQVAIVVIAFLLAGVALLVARDRSSLEAEREARAAAADAVVPLTEALRTELSAAASGTAAGSKQVSVADGTQAGVSSAIATRARDLGVAALADSGSGVVVAATYDTASPPASVQERRDHMTGLRVAPLELGRTLSVLRPARGGIALAGPEHTVRSLPGPRPPDVAGYTVKLGRGTAPDWTLTVWKSSAPLSASAWLAALGFVVLGVGAAGWLVRRDNRARRSQEELVRLQETSATTAALATVAQHSLDLADLLPALTNELTSALDLQGVSLGAPTPDGERQFFAWGVTPADVAASSVLPAEVLAGETLCLVLGRGGRTISRLRVVAGRDLDRHDLRVLGAATEVLTSALTNAEAFAQQRDVLERMRSVDELKTVFLATASHELRTPVGAITAYAQLLAASWDSLSPDEARTYAQQVDSHARRLATLVDNLLDFSRLERGDGVASANSVLDLGEVVTRILDEQPDLAPDHQVVHQTAPGLAVAGTLPAVERVVTNLVGNAAKYSPAGTVIRVSVTEDHGRVELTVDDEGPGVPPAEREQVFTRFFRGHGDAVVATRGAGLGLAIVTEFAATMGGQVSVTSAESGGARFVVSYPLAAGQAESTVEGASDVPA